MNYYVMSPEEAIAWLDNKNVKYEVCDTPIPIMGNKVNCGVTLGIGDEMIEGYYYLPKSATGLHPLIDIPAQGDSMIDAGIEEGDLLKLEIGALPCDGDIVLAEIDGESTVKVFFTDAEKRYWLCPMNQRYRPIQLKETMNVRITGVVRMVVKCVVRQSYRECMAILDRANAQRQKEADVMQRLGEAVSDGGHLFWASASWAVAYAVLRDVCGYEGSMTEFERKAHEMAAAGTPLTADTLNKVYHDLVALYYDGADVDEAIDAEWSFISHFYRGFYVYQYATGFSSAVAIADSILSTGDASGYLKFLTTGGSDYPLNELKIAGVDLTKPDTVKNALKVFADTVDEMEKLL